MKSFDGERANTGLIGVTDRPWRPMLDEVIKTNFDIYQVLVGRRPPFEYAAPRFKNTD